MFLVDEYVMCLVGACAAEWAYAVCPYPVQGGGHLLDNGGGVGGHGFFPVGGISG